MVRFRKIQATSTGSTHPPVTMITFFEFPSESCFVMVAIGEGREGKTRQVGGSSPCVVWVPVCVPAIPWSLPRLSGLLSEDIKSTCQPEDYSQSGILHGPGRDLYLISTLNFYR